ncbi:MAG TPA: PepSY domain-containing protein [Solirubrobacteraceae bacterium]|nr:PepSY domain-containing protein [Solirubrobacteraceae bacterium]
MHKKIATAASTAAAVAVTSGIALAATGGGDDAATAAPAGAPTTARSSSPAAAPTSRLDDGAQLLSQARITEQEAIAAAQTAASGPLNEVDLEHRDGRLVFNVDVGRADVKVDASTGQVVATDHDDSGGSD